MKLRIMMMSNRCQTQKEISNLRIWIEGLKIEGDY